MWASNSNRLMSEVTWTRGTAKRLIFAPNPPPVFIKAQRKPACSASRKSRCVTVAALPKGYPKAQTVCPRAFSRTPRLSKISRRAHSSESPSWSRIWSRKLRLSSLSNRESRSTKFHQHECFPFDVIGPRLTPASGRLRVMGSLASNNIRRVRHHTFDDERLASFLRLENQQR